MFELKKIGIVKRASAWLLDAILLAVLATGFMYVISLICNFSTHESLAREYNGQWTEYRKTYIQEVAAYYGFDCVVDEDGGLTIYFDATHADEASLDDVIHKFGEMTKLGEEEEAAKRAELPENIQIAYDAFKALPSAGLVNKEIQTVFSMLFMMVSIGLLLSFLVMEFILPIVFKNGQTVGKKVFGICVVKNNCVRIRPVILFARTVLGKFAVETMFPILLVFLLFFGVLGWLAIGLFAAILLLNLILFFATRNRTPIHDLFAGTVAVDMKLQIIFDTEEELIEAKKLIHKENVESSKY